MTATHVHASEAITCPTCATSISLDPSQRSALDKVVSEASEQRIKDAISERDRLAEQETTRRVEVVLARTQAEHVAVLAERDAALAAAESRTALAVNEAVNASLLERAELRNALDNSAIMHEVQIKSLEERYQAQLHERDEAIERLRDMKVRLSTKMVGESLEQHCETEFEKVRAMAFSTATFKKDNDASTGSKGDYVFADHDDDGNTVCSIMFEMKNETDPETSTASKHKNVEFLAKLDRDRREKGCEYAVLVSLLEPESELYNTGIVDVSHLFAKTYVIRPQFFVPMITLLRNAARSAAHDAAALRAALAASRAENVDLVAFEQDLDLFKAAFGKNYESSAKHLDLSVEGIDKAIAQLNRVRESLVTSQRQMRLANDKAQDVSLRKLAKNNSTIQQLLAGRVDEDD